MLAWSTTSPITAYKLTPEYTMKCEAVKKKVRVEKDWEYRPKCLIAEILEDILSPHDVFVYASIELWEAAKPYGVGPQIGFFWEVYNQPSPIEKWKVEMKDGEKTNGVDRKVLEGQGSL